MHFERSSPARRARAYPTMPSPAKKTRASGPSTQPSRATVAKMHSRSGSYGVGAGSAVGLDEPRVARAWVVAACGH